VRLAVIHHLPQQHGVGHKANAHRCTLGSQAGRVHQAVHSAHCTPQELSRQKAEG
jgi:hypothetical protein